MYKITLTHVEIAFVGKSNILDNLKKKDNNVHVNWP